MRGICLRCPEGLARKLGAIPLNNKRGLTLLADLLMRDQALPEGLIEIDTGNAPYVWRVVPENEQ